MTKTSNGQRIRVHKTKDYTVMSNYHLKEKGMSLKAKGLLSVILSLPDDWDYSIAGLAAISKENETAIKSALQELKEFGYLKITKKMPNETDTGRIEYCYDIFERPIKKQEGEKQGVENLGVEFLGVEFLGVENQGQLNTNKETTNNKVKTTKDIIDQWNNEFEEVWNEYPKKQGKTNAQKAFLKARKDGVGKDTILNGLRAYKAFLEANKTDFKYIKQGSTWFNQQCWNDDYTVQKKSGQSVDDEYLAYLDSLG